MRKRIRFTNRELYDRITLPVFQNKCSLNGHLKIEKTKVLKTGGSLMQVVSIAECSFCKTIDLH